MSYLLNSLIFGDKKAGQIEKNKQHKEAQRLREEKLRQKEKELELKKEERREKARQKEKELELKKQEQKEKLQQKEKELELKQQERKDKERQREERVMREELQKENNEAKNKYHDTYFPSTHLSVETVEHKPQNPSQNEVNKTSQGKFVQYGLDKLFEMAAHCVVSRNHISSPMLQRKFNLGYNRAERIVAQLEEHGVISTNKNLEKVVNILSEDKLITFFEILKVKLENEK